MKPVRVFAAALATCVLGSNIAMANDDAVLRSALSDCARLRNSSERLACYDGLAAGKPTANGKSAEAMFGMRSDSVRTPTPADSESAREQTASITAKVQALTALADGRVIVSLDNGQRWRQESGGELMLEVGDAVTIERGALSSFRLTSAKKRFARVKRLD